MFEVNEYVSYGASGVCRITDITEKKICGVCNKYYVLKPVFENKSTVYVPADNAQLTSKMRKVLSAEEIYQLIRSVSSESIIWIENEQERKKEYARILSAGNRSELIRMIKAVYLHKQSRLSSKKKLHISDENFLKEAERRLYEEFAHVLNIKQSQVVPFIAEQIEVNKKTET